MTMPGSWSDEYEQDQGGYDRVRVQRLDDNDYGGWGHTPPRNARRNAGANHGQRNKDNDRAAPPPQTHPERRRQPGVCISASPAPRATLPLEFAAGEIRLAHGSGLPVLPFCTAARKLQITLTRSLDFFRTFHREFQRETKALDAYADPALINRAWRNKIRNSERYLMPSSSSSSSNRNKAGRKDQASGEGDHHHHSDNANTSHNNGDGDGNGHGNGNGATPMFFAATVPDLRTFSELQREVIERVTALYHANLPKSRLCAPTDKHSLEEYPNYHPSEFDVDHDNNDDDAEDAEDDGYCSRTDRRIIEQWNLARSLKQHVQDSYARLIRAVRRIDTDYMAGTPATRELEMLKRDLEIYRRGWDETCRHDDEGCDWDAGEEKHAETEESMGRAATY